MPFDVVYLDKFEASKSLSVKNLIGRAVVQLLIQNLTTVVLLFAIMQSHRLEG